MSGEKVKGLGTITEDQKKQKKQMFAETVKPIDLNEATSIADLVESFGGMSIQARNIGKCGEVLKNMMEDPDRPTVMLGIAGPLIAAGLRKTLREMISSGMVDAVVSTGAIIYQDIYQARGFQHYKGSPLADDSKLRELHIDRIYDTYVDEDKFWETDCWIGRYADEIPAGNYSSRAFLEKFALDKLDDDSSILLTAAKKGVPVFCPAINDSSIGIGLTEHYHRCVTEKRKGVSIDSIRDNYELTQMVVQSKKTAAIYIAGGVPKNYINDSVVMSYIFDENTGGHTYALQLTTDVPHWGGLSGSTLDEAMSWGKINKKAMKHMAFVEPSVSLPLLVGYAKQRDLMKSRKPLSLTWEDDILKSCK